MKPRVTLQPVLILALAVLLGTPSLEWTTEATNGQKIAITLKEHSFTPVNITLQAGVPAEITLTNRGTLKHEFWVYVTPKAKVSDWEEYMKAHTYFKEIGEVEAEFEGIGAVAGARMFEVEVQPGKEAELKFTPSRKGTFEMACHVEGHYEAGMKGTLIVK